MMTQLLRRRVLGSLTGAIWLASPLAAETSGEALARLLRVDEVVAVMRDEGMKYGDDLDAEMLAGTGGQYFANRVDRIYDADRMEASITQALDDGLNETDIAASMQFYEVPLGQQILSLENAARVAMADPDVDALAREAYREREGSDDARLAAITDFVEMNDLLERNVAAALSSSYQFYRGLVDGGSLEMGEDEIIADVWSEEEEVREDTEGWIYGFLLMAYRPLSDDELVAYNQFSETPAGQALNAALFDGFDKMYRDISYALGKSVAEAMESSDI